MCTRNGLQCCTEEYIEEVLNHTQELLPDGVRAELNRTIEIYARIIRRLQNCKTPMHAQVAHDHLIVQMANHFEPHMAIRISTSLVLSEDV